MQRIGGIKMEQRATLRLNDLISKLQKNNLMPQAVHAAKLNLQILIRRGYDTSTDAKGNIFAPLKRFTGKRPVIGLRDFYQFTERLDSVYITSSKPYAVYHHFGTEKMPARTPWPIGKNAAVPYEWKEIIKDSLNRVLQRSLLQ